MHHLEKPTKQVDPDYDITQIYDKCISKLTGPDKANLKNKKPVLIQAEVSYNCNFSNGTKCPIALTHTALAPLTRQQLNALYEKKMLRGPLRKIYNKLLATGKEAGCCFCSHGEAEELDHFLPKSIFPEFSICPINLVPICSRCNKKKSTEYEKLIHPYYENYDAWLDAAITFENNSPLITYFISNKFCSGLKQRLEFQFNTLGLEERYKTLTSREIPSYTTLWKNAKAKRGREGVKEDIIESLESFKNAKIKQHWRIALYTCLSQSDEFCAMDWE